MLIQGTLDANGDFIAPNKPIVFEEINSLTIQGTLDQDDNFVHPTFQPTVFQTNGSIILQGTLDANGDFTSSTFRPQATLISGDLRIQGTLDANGNFIQPESALAYKLEDGYLIQGTYEDSTFTPSNKPTVFSDSWTPLEIFKNGATGLWLAGGDPSQRYGEYAVAPAYLVSAGVTPLSEAGQSAGLVINKSDGVVGPELINDPNFDNASDWSLGPGWSVSGGKAIHTGTAGYLSQTNPNAELGEWYRIDVDVESVAGGSLLQIYVGDSPSLAPAIASSGTYVYYGQGNGPLVLGFALRGVGDVEVNSFSVKTFPTYHAVQPTAAARPTLRFDSDIGKYYWEPDGADYWECDGAAGTLTGDFEIHAAVRWVNNRAIVSKMDTTHTESATPRGWMLYSSAGGAPIFLYRPPSGGAVPVQGSSNIDTGTDLVISAWRVDDVISLAIDGEVVASIGPINNSGEEYGDFDANLQLFRTWRGSNGWGNYWNSRLYGDGLVIINNKSLTTDERTKVITNLALQQGRTL